MSETTGQNGGAKPSLVLPSGAEAAAALSGSLDDSGHARSAAPIAAAVRDWTVAEARDALGLPARPTSWVGDVGDPMVFAENERRKIVAALGDLSGIAELIWNRTLLAVWKGPSEKKLAGGGSLVRTGVSRDEDTWQGNCGLVVRLGPTAFVSGTDEETGDKIYYPQAPKVGDWVYFSRGYGTRVKINDVQCVLLDKETEALKLILHYPHAVDIT